MLHRILIAALTTASVVALPVVASAQEGSGEGTAESPGATTTAEPEPVHTSAAPAYAPRRFNFAGMYIETPVSFAERVDYVTPFAIDADGNELRGDAAFDTRARLGARFSTERALAPIRLYGEWQQDVVTGIHEGGTDRVIDDITLDAPRTPGVETQLRRAYGQVDITQYLHLIGGRMTSHWGLGLVANDGSHGWTPGSAAFTDPRGGDRNLRGMVVVGPFTDHSLALAGGYDVAKADDVLRDSDTAWQVFGALNYGFGRPTNAGVYVVSRHQESEIDVDATDVIVVDVTGGHTFDLGGDLSLRLEGEGAFVTGETTFGSSVEFDTHTVRQIGGLLRLSFASPHAGAVLDVLYASGDDNSNDDVQAGFRADPNLHMGLLIFDDMLAGFSSRQPYTSYDPDLSGLPNEDLDRLTTRGQITNTLAIFPRGWWRFCDSVELYGGPLIALAPEYTVDPFNTRIAGGDPRNAFNASGGKYLGTELDLGLRYRGIFAGTQLDVGAEGAVLFPGSAAEGADGKPIDPILGARLFVEYAL